MDKKRTKPISTKIDDKTGKVFDSKGHEIVHNIQQAYRQDPNKKPKHVNSGVQQMYDNNKKPDDVNYEKTGPGIVEHLIDEVGASMIDKFINKTDKIASSRILKAVIPNDKTRNIVAGGINVATGLGKVALGAKIASALSPLAYGLYNKIFKNHSSWYGGDSVITTVLNPLRWAPKTSLSGLKILNIEMEPSFLDIATAIPAAYTTALNQWLLNKYTVYGIPAAVPAISTFYANLAYSIYAVSMFKALQRYENGNLAMIGNKAIGNLVLGAAIEYGLKATVFQAGSYVTNYVGAANYENTIMTDYNDLTKNTISSKAWNVLTDRLLKVIHILPEMDALTSYLFSGIHTYDVLDEEESYVCFHPLASVALTKAYIDAGTVGILKTYRGDLLSNLEACIAALEASSGANPWMDEMYAEFGFITLASESLKRDNASRSILIVKDPGMYIALNNMGEDNHILANVGGIIQPTNITYAASPSTFIDDGTLHYIDPQNTMINAQLAPNKFEFSIGELGSATKFATIFKNCKWLNVLSVGMSTGTGLASTSFRLLTNPTQFITSAINAGAIPTYIDTIALCQATYLNLHSMEEKLKLVLTPTMGAGAGVTSMLASQIREEDMDSIKIPNYELLSNMIYTRILLGLRADDIITKLLSELASQNTTNTIQ